MFRVDGKVLKTSLLGETRWLFMCTQVGAVLHELCFMVNGESKSATIQHVNCDILLAEEKITYSSYTSYRNTLHALVSKSIMPPISPRLSSLKTNDF